MGRVLTTQSKVTCGHAAGTVKIDGATSKLRVKDNPVLLATDVKAGVVATCGSVVSPDKPCLKVKEVSNVQPPPKLTIGGVAVLVEAMKGATDGTVGGVTPQLLLSAAAVQNKLTTT